MPPATCVPMKDLKNTAAFTRTVQSASGPVFVTKNGSEAFVSMSMECYEALLEDAARSRLYLAIEQGEADIAAGRTQDAHEAIAQLRDRYGLAN